MPEFDFGVLPLWIYDFLVWWLQTNLGVEEAVANGITRAIGVFMLANFVMLTPIFTIWLERKLAARFQDRLGPNRVGPYGLFQSFADIAKLATKEMIIPTNADKVVYFIAPVLAVMSAMTIWVVIPFMGGVVGASLNVGVLYIVAVSGLGTLAIIMAGWSSNNKYALLGAFRGAAQLLSYEIPLIMGLLVPVILAGSMDMTKIVAAQSGGQWFIIAAPVATLLFFLASIAEIGRTPFDLLEAESEIVAGFNIEYSGMGFAMFMLAEFIHAFTLAALIVVLFFGGWQGPWVANVPILGIGYFMAKTYLAYFVIVWIRSTLPRVRIDHMMDFNWKFLVPLSLVLVMVTAIVEKLVAGISSTWTQVWIHFGVSVVFFWMLLQVLRWYGRAMRKADMTRRIAWETEREAPDAVPAGVD